MQLDTKHFHLDFPLPKHASIKPYVKKPQPNNKAKNKHKLTKFTYYRTPEGIIKVLFLDDQHFIDQGYYPFTNPSGQKRSFSEFKGQVERIIYLESVYICHYEEEGVTKLVTKKITEAKVDSKTSQIDTIDDRFQILPIGNIQRWNQFLKIQKCNPNAAGSSIRVIVDEKFGQEKEAQILDYEFFQREQSLKKNKSQISKQYKKPEPTKLQQPSEQQKQVIVAKKFEEQININPNQQPKEVQLKDEQKKQTKVTKKVQQQVKVKINQQPKDKAKKNKH